LFIDEITIEVKSGSGGDGIKHFKRERRNPKGGPDGGDGGRGGHIMLRTSHHLHTLFDIHSKPLLKSHQGNPGEPYRKKGKDAEDIILEVPIGTIAHDDVRGEKLCELLEHDVSFTLARGGKGGMGNNSFKTSQVRAPDKFTTGEAGETKKIRLELKLLADCGLVGFPNAGKSSLVKALSNATPKIGDFPFTTLKPSLGIVSLKPGMSFTIADIPGIIEGAAEGKGLGNQFLRHIERTACLAFVISSENEDLWGNYQSLVKELGNYKKELLVQPKIILIHKVDLGQPEIDARFKDENCDVILTSTISLEGLDELKRKVWYIIKEDEDSMKW